jgi:hypothetical protein
MSARKAAPAIGLHPYQQRWFNDRLEIVDDIFEKMLDGRRAHWVILSSGERQAREAMESGIKPHAAAYGLALQELGGPSSRGTPPKVDARALEVVFPNGARVTALPANPDTARGFSANVYLDEFAFHRDDRRIWRALCPVISAGHSLRVTYTPNGKGNKFHELLSARDDDWSRHVVDIHQAVADGLPRDIEVLRRNVGDAEAWAQEYELKFRDRASAWLPHGLVVANEHPDAGKLDLYQGGPCYIGNDIALRGDLWVAWVWEEMGQSGWAAGSKAWRSASVMPSMLACSAAEVASTAPTWLQAGTKIRLVDDLHLHAFGQKEGKWQLDQAIGDQIGAPKVCRHLPHARMGDRRKVAIGIAGQPAEAVILVEADRQSGGAGGLAEARCAGGGRGPKGQEAVQNTHRILPPTGGFFAGPPGGIAVAAAFYRGARGGRWAGRGLDPEEGGPGAVGMAGRVAGGDEAGPAGGAGDLAKFHEVGAQLGVSRRDAGPPRLEGLLAGGGQKQLVAGGEDDALDLRLAVTAFGIFDRFLAEAGLVHLQAGDPVAPEKRIEGRILLGEGGPPERYDLTRPEYVADPLPLTALRKGGSQCRGSQSIDPTSSTPVWRWPPWRRWPAPSCGPAPVIGSAPRRRSLLLWEGDARPPTRTPKCRRGPPQQLSTGRRGTLDLEARQLHGPGPARRRLPHGGHRHRGLAGLFVARGVVARGLRGKPALRFVAEGRRRLPNHQGNR